MDQRVLSPPHGLSQSATSFIASYRQGIHQTPFMRLIRSSKRKTKLESCLSSPRLDVRAAPAIRPVWCLVPPIGVHSELQRSQLLAQY